MSEEIWSIDRCLTKYNLLTDVWGNMIQWQMPKKIWSRDKCLRKHENMICRQMFLEIWSIRCLSRYNPVINVWGNMIPRQMSEEIWSDDKCPKKYNPVANYRGNMIWWQMLKPKWSRGKCLRKYDPLRNVWGNMIWWQMSYWQILFGQVWGSLVPDVFVTLQLSLCWCCCCGSACCDWSHYIKLWSINVHLGLLEVDVEFLWWWWGGGCWGGGVVCTVIFVSNPTAVLRLCCVVLSLGLWQFINGWFQQIGTFLPG